MHLRPEDFDGGLVRRLAPPRLASYASNDGEFVTNAIASQIASSHGYRLCRATALEETEGPLWVAYRRSPSGSERPVPATRCCLVDRRQHGQCSLEFAFHAYTHSRARPESIGVLTFTQHGLSDVPTNVHCFNSKMLSISTGIPIGNVCTPSALRAGSLLCPNSVSNRSLAPLATCGCWVNDCSART